MTATLTPSAPFMISDPVLQTQSLDATQIVIYCKNISADFQKFSVDASQISSPGDFFDIVGLHVFTLTI